MAKIGKESRHELPDVRVYEPEERIFSRLKLLGSILLHKLLCPMTLVPWEINSAALTKSRRIAFPKAA